MKLTFENHIMSVGFNKIYTKESALVSYRRFGELEILNESENQCTFRFKTKEAFNKARKHEMMLYNNGKA